MIEEFHGNYIKQHLVKKPIFWGVIGGSILLIIYFGILSFANSFSHALQQFKDMWYWIILLVVGFGLQMALFTYMRAVLKIKKDTGIASSTVAATGGVSATSMVACCAHHVTDVIPILGISAAAVFLNQFQTFFIILGILSNLIGINFMLKIIQEHGLYMKKQNVMSILMKFNMKKILRYTLAGSIFLLLIIFFNNL